MARRCEVGRECPRHSGVVHGAEAEELRSGIERLYERLSAANPRDFDVDDVLRDLNRLLETVDARDSLAWLEMCKRRPGLTDRGGR